MESRKQVADNLTREEDFHDMVIQRHFQVNSVEKNLLLLCELF